MQFINYFFASAIAFSGLLIGLLLARIAPEEQKPLEKYFILTRKILLFLVFIFVLFYFFNSYINLAILLAYFAFLLFAEHSLKDLFKKNMIAYTLLGVVFFLSSRNSNLFAIESSLILLYGLPAAALTYDKREKNHYRVVLYNAGFVIIAALLFFV